MRIIPKSRAPSRTGTLFTSLLAGGLLGTLQITFALAFTALIFPPELSAYFTQGVAIILFGSIICFVMLALFSSYRGAIGSAQNIPASISAVMAVSIVTSMGSDTDSYIVFSTVVAAMATASFISACLLIIMGTTELGKVIRFIPYPVIGGLLISTGWILAKAGFDMMPQQWLIGSCFAVFLLVARKLFVSPWVLPVILVASVIGINLYLLFQGISVEAAREQGFLADIELGKIPFIQSPLTVFSAADWGIVTDHLATIISLCIITCLMVLIQISTIEVIVKQEIEPKRELCVTGLANVIVAFCCGLINYHHIASTTLAYNMGARTRTVGIMTALVCSSVFVTNSQWMEYLPLPILAGLILYLGLLFLYQWLIEAYRNLPRNEYLIMLGIFAFAIFINFPAAIILGVVCGIFLILFQHNRVGIIQSVIPAQNCASSVMRSAQESAFLAQYPQAIRAFKLKGMLYFGTAHELYELTKRYMHKQDFKDCRYIIFDFENVAAIDSSALMSLLRTHEYLNENSVQLIVCTLSGQQSKQIRTFYSGNEIFNSLFMTDSLDHALEYCEEQILKTADFISTEHTDCIEDIFKKQGWDTESITLLKGYLQKLRLHDHQVLIRSGQEDDDIYIIDSGRLEIVSKSTNNNPVRLRVLSSGMVVGEMSLYSGMPRSADVIASGSATVYRLSAEKLELLQLQHPEIAIELHKYFGSIMVHRFIDESRLQAIRSS